MTHALALRDPFLNVTPQFLQDPYPHLKQLQELAPIMWSEHGHYWLLTRYADCDYVLRDLRFNKQISSLKGGSAIRRLVLNFILSIKANANATKSMLSSDPPDHTRLRSLVSIAFTPIMIEQMRARIQEVTDNLLYKEADKGSMDLVADLAFPLPVIVIAEMLGIAPEDRDRLKKWSNALIGVLEPGASFLSIFRAGKARDELVSYLRPLIKERRTNPNDDLISALVKAEDEQGKLSSDELLATITLLLVAGHETTLNLISSAALALMTHTDQMQLLKNNSNLLGNAVKEFLRWNSPIQLIRRSASEDCELSGVHILKGQTLLICNGAANRDPAQYPNPDRLDIQRQNIKHLAFGAGIHHCLGWFLAETECQIAIGTLLKRMPSMTLRIPEEKLEWKRPCSVRGLKKLPISW